MALAKDTLVFMADGTKKRIDEVRPGDAVADANGAVRRVEDVTMGVESRLIHMETLTGHTLNADEQQEVETGRGVIGARYISVVEDISTSEGMAVIRQIYPMEYNGAAYTLRLDESAMVLCNGVKVRF